MKYVYTVVTRERDGKKFWVRIGTAYEGAEAGVPVLNVMLDAVPTNGTLQIRSPIDTSAEPKKAGE